MTEEEPTASEAVAPAAQAEQTGVPAEVTPEVVSTIIGEQDALVAGFYEFEEMIWKRINEPDGDTARAAVALWVSEGLARVQAQVQKEIDSLT